MSDHKASCGCWIKVIFSISGDIYKVEILSVCERHAVSAQPPKTYTYPEFVEEFLPNPAWRQIGEGEISMEEYIRFAELEERIKELEQERENIMFANLVSVSALSDRVVALEARAKE